MERAYRWGLIGATALLLGCSEPAPEPSLPIEKPKTTAAAPREEKPRDARHALPTKLDWNDDSVEWLRYDAGLEVAAAEGKPILAVVYADWCHHCKQYGRNFYEASVLEKTESYVMVRVNQDREPATSRLLAPDGDYLPRTLLLTSSGEIQDVAAAPSRFRYFYDYRDPAQLVSALERGLENRAGRGAP